MLELAMATIFTVSPPVTPDARLDWWRNARFGMFIHWGLYSVPAGTWGEETGHAEWIRTTAEIPRETYDGFVDQFNPVNFDADAWCDMAADAGMGYIVITSKHHDGFCLFDSEHTDFDIMATPFKRDIMTELTKAAPKHGLRMCWYHSIMDWHHDDYLPRRGWETERSAEGADMDRFREYLHAQVTELLTNYGPIGVMWFDGEWERTWRGEYGAKLYELCRKLQPDVIVNNRLGARGGMEGMTGIDGYAGGYGGDYATPEQEIPDAVEKGLDWETCMTMNDRWGYNVNDTNFKSTTDLIRKLSDIVSKNGNFLLNVGPKPDGTFPQESIDRLAEIGDWMDVNGEAIHGTTGSPFSTLPWGRCTQKPNGDDTTLYLHVFDWPHDGLLTVPGLAGDVQSARVLGSTDFSASVEKGDGVVTVSVPSSPPSVHVSIVAVDVAGSPVIYEAPVVHAQATSFVDSIEVTMDVGSPDLEIRYTVEDSYGRRAPVVYQDPITIKRTTTVSAQTFDGRQSVSEPVSMEFMRVEPWPASDSKLQPSGLQLETYTGDWDVLPDFSTLQPSGESIVDTIAADPRNEFEGRVFSGYVHVDRDAMYMFALESDDGSMLLIDDTPIIDNDGLHGSREMRGTAPLAAGWHAIRVEWFNKTGGAELELRMGELGETLMAENLTFTH